MEQDAYRARQSEQHAVREDRSKPPPPTNVEHSKGLVETQGVFCRRLSE